MVCWCIGWGFRREGARFGVVGLGTVGVAGADRQRGGGGGREIGVAVRWGVAIGPRGGGEARVSWRRRSAGIRVGRGRGVECALLQRGVLSGSDCQWVEWSPVGET